MNTINFKLEGLTCEACVKLAASRLKKIPGVYKVEIDLMSGQATVLSAADINLGLVKQSLVDLTYKIAQ